jgi:hypothetical protein
MPTITSYTTTCDLTAVLTAALIVGCGGQDTDEPAQPGGQASAPETTARKAKPCPPSTSKVARASKRSASGLTEAARRDFARFQGCPWASRIHEIEVTVDRDTIANINRQELLLVTDAGPEFVDEDMSVEDRAAVEKMSKAGVAWGRVNLGGDPRLDIVHDREYHILALMERLATRDCDI